MPHDPSTDLQPTVDLPHSPAQPETLHTSGIDASLTATAEIVSVPTTDATIVPGYEIREEIGRGGMGVVYRAYDPAMRREVAVKILQDKYAPDSNTAIRFVEEAQITGQLQHPGIPAVYQVSKQPDGRPYLAMKLIKGNTLDELLKSNASINRLAVFEAICQAVGYAHAHNVIHRDLKPANIMVGAFGEVLVMDWGLAKILANVETTDRLATTTDPEVTTAPTEIQSLRDSEGSFTQAGSIMGTPAYMPPEQAGGEIAKIDQRADVFALGALLCVLLTGKPPYEGSSADSVKLNAMRGKTEEAFARLDAYGAEPEVVALCKQCLAFEPADRPKNATAVGTIIANVRTDAEARAKQAELAQVKAEVQAAEQRKRRRVLMWSAVAVFTVLSLGITASLWQTKRAMEAEHATAEQLMLTQAAEAKATTEAENAKSAATRAEKARDRTRDVLDTMTTDVTGDSLATQNEISPEQKYFLSEVLTYYQEFAGESASDEQTRYRTARAASRVGVIQSRFGRKIEALTAYRQALTGFSKLEIDFPAVPIYRERVADSHYNIGSVQDDLGQRTEALEAYRNALAIRENLIADFPTVLTYRADVAASHNNIGVLHKDLGQRTEALEAFWKALAIRVKLMADFPAAPIYRERVADSHNNIGVLHKDLGQRTEALEAYGKALAIREKLIADFPTVPTYRADVAASHNNIGVLHKDLGQRTEALEAYRKALAIRVKLMADFPAAPIYRERVADSHNNIGLLQVDLGQRTEALEAYGKALAIREKLMADFPTVPTYRADVADSHNNIGSVQDDLGQRTEALEAYGKALAIREKLIADFPTVPTYRADVAASHNNIGLLHKDLGQRSEALEANRKALAIREKLMADFPAVPTYRADVAASHNNIGLVQHYLGQRTEALEAFWKALAIREKLMADFPAAPIYRERVADSHNNIGIVQMGLGESSAAMESYRKALAIREKLMADFPAVPTYRADVADSHNNIGLLLDAEGQFIEAIASHDKSLHLREALLNQEPANVSYQKAVEISKSNVFDSRNAVKAIADIEFVFQQPTEKIHVLLDIRMKALLKRNKPADAMATAERFAAWAEKQEVNRGGERYNAACSFALCATAFEMDRDTLVDKSLALLNKAKSNGYFDAKRIAHIKQDADFNGIRQHPKFVAFLADLEQPAELAPLPRLGKP